MVYNNFCCFSQENLCLHVIPTLIGLLRALGRASNEEVPLISHLLSVHSEPFQNQANPTSSKAVDMSQQKSSIASKSIIPRSMSSLELIRQEDTGIQSAGSLHRSCLDNHNTASSGGWHPRALDSSITLEKNKSQVKSMDPADVYFNKVVLFCFHVILLILAKLLVMHLGFMAQLDVCSLEYHTRLFQHCYKLYYLPFVC